jgi:hypothetical protein
VQIYDHPWYNKNLPPGVKEMNDHPQPLPAGLQSQEEIQKIVAVSEVAEGGACKSKFTLPSNFMESTCCSLAHPARTAAEALR